VRSHDENDPSGHAVIFKDKDYAAAIYDPDNDGVVDITVQRLDGQPARDWRDLQRIKNELVGAEREAVELYPQESRLMDMSNTTHFVCLARG